MYLIDTKDYKAYQINEQWTIGEKIRIPCPIHEGTNKNCQLGPDNGYFCHKCNSKGFIDCIS